MPVPEPAFGVLFLDEPNQDKRLAREIRALALQFKGMSRFQTALALPDFSKRMELHRNAT